MFLLLAPSLFAQTALPDAWPVEVKVTEAEALAKRCSALEPSAPAELKPALRFQQTFLKILSTPLPKTPGQDPAWVPEARVLIAGDRSDLPVTHGVAEVARAWLARAHMTKIQAGLTQYYRRHVQFPEQLNAILPSLPEPVRADPWGQPWAYRPLAPRGFSSLAGQRFQIGPAAYPTLPELGKSAGDRKLSVPAWKITRQQIAEKPALELRAPNTAPALLQPGGKAGEFTLLYIGETWALFAAPDQLFALRYP